MIREFCTVAVAGMTLALPLTASADIVASFESAPGSFDGWADTFGSRPIVLAAGTTGVTDGAQSLALTLDGDGFSWDLGNDFDFAAFTAAVEAGGTLEFDVTYDTSTIPQTDVTFLNMSVALNDGSWTQQDSLAVTNGSTDETIHVSLSLVGDLGAQTPGEGAGFYQINLAFNGDWEDAANPRDTEAIVYLDNIRITPEPTSVGLLAAGGLVMLSRRRRA